MPAIMSVDVEEWFHIPEGLDNVVPFDEWGTALQRITKVFPLILDTFEKNQVKATFFFLGWIGEKYPGLVRDAASRGHEIATHGYAHKLIYNQTPAEFKDDISRSKAVLENITGLPVIGYRAPGFSITPQTTWAFDILGESGFRYDSSVFPGNRFYGTFRNFGLNPAIVKTPFNDIVEFPQSLLNFGSVRFSCFGGGYLRLYPRFVILRACSTLLKTARPLIIYIHPRDLDTGQPRLSFSFFRQIRHYINISQTTAKLDALSGSIRFRSFDSLIADKQFVSMLNVSSWSRTQ